LLNKFQFFDSHFHIIDKHYPLIPNNGYIPEKFTCDDYLKKMSEYNLCGGTVVSGSFQAFDQTYLIDALKKIGPSYVGVTQLPVDVKDEEIINLNKSGIRAVRFNLKRGGSEDIKHLSSMAQRIHELAGWHIELYLDSAELAEIYDKIITLPSVSIDHLGLSKSGLKLLTKLAEKGVKVKATGFSRVDFDVKSSLKILYSANPHSLLFGTDLPSTRAPKPYTDRDFMLVAETLGENAAKNVFYQNALDFYKIQNSV